MNDNIRLEMTGYCKNCPTFELDYDTYEDGYGRKYVQVRCMHESACERWSEKLGEGEGVK